MRLASADALASLQALNRSASDDLALVSCSASLDRWSRCHLTRLQFYEAVRTHRPAPSAAELFATAGTPPDAQPDHRANQPETGERSHIPGCSIRAEREEATEDCDAPHYGSRDPHRAAAPIARLQSCEFYRIGANRGAR